MFPREPVFAWHRFKHDDFSTLNDIPSSTDLYNLLYGYKTLASATA
jgi:hypothetical protein